MKKRPVSLTIFILIIILSFGSVHAAANKAAGANAGVASSGVPAASASASAFSKVSAAFESASSSSGIPAAFASASSSSGTSATTPLDFIISWVSTDENKRALLNAAAEADIKLGTDSKWSWMLTLLETPSEFAPAAGTDRLSVPAKPDLGGKPTTVLPSAAAAVTAAVKTTEAPGLNTVSAINSINLLQLTKPLKIDDKQTVTYDNFLVCGKVTSPQVNVSLAVYSSEKNRYEAVGFAKDKKGVRIYSGLFAEELVLKKGRNRIKVTAYTDAAPENPRFGENIQIQFFDVYYVDKNIVNADRDITDYFKIPSLGSFKFNMSKTIKID